MFLGLPELTEYHLMNNKRYILTNDSEKKVKLWELETGKCVHKFSEPFNAVKQLLSEKFDLIGSKQNPIPNTWMSIDLRLGVSNITKIANGLQSLTIQLEEDKWIKGIVNKQLSDVVSKLESKEENKDNQILVEGPPSNLGLNLIHRVFFKAK